MSEVPLREGEGERESREREREGGREKEREGERERGRERDVGKFFWPENSPAPFSGGVSDVGPKKILEHTESGRSPFS